jgi:hypothetical protein
VKFGEPNDNYSTLKFMHFEPSALYQSKWEEDELGATSSETRTVTQIFLIRHFGLRQIKLTANILKQSLRLNSFHQPRYVSNVVRPNACMLRMFKAHCKVPIGAQIFSI